jgi:hypothetical protein
MVALKRFQGCSQHTTLHYHRASFARERLDQDGVSVR